MSQFPSSMVLQDPQTSSGLYTASHLSDPFFPKSNYKQGKEQDISSRTALHISTKFDIVKMDNNWQWYIVLKLLPTQIHKLAPNTRKNKPSHEKGCVAIYLISTSIYKVKSCRSERTHYPYNLITRLQKTNTSSNNIHKKENMCTRVFFSFFFYSFGGVVWGRGIKKQKSWTKN